MDSIEKLIQAIKPIEVLKSREECLPYDSDWTKTPGEATIVARPRTTAEVSKVLRICFEQNVAVVPSGGRTGLAGGATSQKNCLVLSLERMNQIGHLDLTSLTLQTQAGVTNQAIQEYCQPHGLVWPIDLGSRGSCQIGGNLSTNAGGLHVIRYGMARRWVTGLEVVLMDGSVIGLNHGLEKNNTGYDLLQLMIGSEGTLAVITQATLKLIAQAKKRTVNFFSLPDLTNLRNVLTSAREEHFCLHAFEFFSHKCLEAVASNLGVTSPLSSPGKYYALVEIDSSITPINQIEKWLEKVITKQWVIDGLLAGSSAEEHRVWKLREGITESLQKWAPVRKYDVAVPVGSSVEFLAEAEKLCLQSKYPFELFLFGHFGDGSPHLNLVRKPNTQEDSFLQSCVEFEAELYPLLMKYHGSASAEHGVGLLKKSWLQYSRSRQEIQIFKNIKKIFDPKGLLNPGKLVP